MTKLYESQAIRSIIAERKRQDEKWGDQSHHPMALWMCILVEEVGEAAKAILEDSADLRKELVQVAAVATAAIEALDSREAPR